MRPQEVFTLMRTDVNLPEGYLQYKGGKLQLRGGALPSHEQSQPHCVPVSMILSTRHTSFLMRPILRVLCQTCTEPTTAR